VDKLLSFDSSSVGRGGFLVFVPHIWQDIYRHIYADGPIMMRPAAKISCDVNVP
jgi:hypothetical protein